MKRDINMDEVTGVAIAVVPEKRDNEEVQWSVYFLNLKEVAVQTVLINARGWGLVSGVEKYTAEMRFFLEDVEPGTYKKFEIILPEALSLNNQYWVSFYAEDNIFDKKYLFNANSINEDMLVDIPLINRPGILVD